MEVLASELSLKGQQALKYLEPNVRQKPHAAQAPVYVAYVQQEQNSLDTYNKGTVVNIFEKKCDLLNLASTWMKFW
ncbi:hypothetical protein Peur_005991 [Populus x canadensis]